MFVFLAHIMAFWNRDAASNSLASVAKIVIVAGMASASLFFVHYGAVHASYQPLGAMLLLVGIAGALAAAYATYAMTRSAAIRSRRASAAPPVRAIERTPLIERLGMTMVIVFAAMLCAPAALLLFLGYGLASSTTTLYGDNSGLGVVLILAGIVLFYIVGYGIRAAVRSRPSNDH